LPRRALRQVEGPHLSADDFRVEDSFGFERHRFSGREHRTSNIQRPTFKAEKRCTAEEPQESDLDKPG
jgi:hypothetical protein